MYAVVALVFYFYFLPRSNTWHEKCLYSLPLVILPALYVVVVTSRLRVLILRFVPRRAFILQRALQWYYRWVIEGKEDRLKELRKEKRKILDKVKDTETYKVARELLEKYDPTSLTDKQAAAASSQNVPRSPIANPGLRYRGSPNTQASPVHHIQTPRPAGMQPPRPYPAIMGTPMQPPVRPGQVVPAGFGRPSMGMQPPRMSRPLLPNDRSVVEKLVDYVVGDGPSNRYALICSNCKSHNGMALKDEFEYIAFYCCYCRFPNPARKERPFAPRLAANARPVVSEPDSDSDRTSDRTGVEIVDVSSPNKDSVVHESEEKSGNNENAKEDEVVSSAPNNEQTKDNSLLSEEDEVQKEPTNDDGESIAQAEDSSANVTSNAE